MRVIVIANHLLSQAGLSALLESDEDIDVIAQMPLDETLIDDISTYDADICLVDTGYFPDETTDILNNITTLPLLMLVNDVKTAVNILKDFNRNLGYGVLLQDTDPEVFAPALESIINGLVVLDPLIIDEILPVQVENATALIEALSERELEVLQHLAEGLTNKQIAQALNISANTVKFHLNAILSKLNARSRTEAVVKATRLGLIFL